MAQDRAKLLFQQGVTAAKAGQKEQAFQILQQAVKLDPHNENVWLWLSSVARNDQERAFCLKQLLAINPQNELAIKGLQALGIDPQQQEQQAAAPQTGIPAVSREKLAEIQGAVDEFLRSYNPQPYTPLEIEWIHKEGKRYGEGAARRLRSSVYITAAAGIAAVLVVAIILVLTVFSGDDKQTEFAGSSPVFTSTPTNSPTPTLGEPETPFPANVAAVVITPTPDTSLRLPRGNPNTQPESTAVYPPVGVSEFLGVIEDFGQGNYEAVSTFSEDWRASQTNDCYQEQYYYDAVGLAIQGGRSNLDRAEGLLEEGLVAQRTGAAIINTCRDSALLQAGLCFVRYQQAISNPENIDQNGLNIAAQSCQTALADSPELVPAADTLGQISLTQYNALNDSSLLGLAQSALVGALTDLSQPANQGNVILLLRLAEVELARGNQQEALIYVSRALYVDPVSETALRLQTEIHLGLAQTASDPDIRTARYSLAVKAAAEQYLFYYPGASMGYALLADARYGEGNVERAFQIANRLIEALETAELSDESSQALERAYQLRVAVYLNRHDWSNALADIDRLQAFQPDNLQLLESHKLTALALKRYALVIDDIDDLLDEFPERNDLVLEKAALLTRTCQYVDTLSCEYEDVLADLLTDTFIESLPEGSTLRANAMAYRLEAEFALLIEDEVDDEDEEALLARSEALQALLTQLEEQVLSSRETGEDYYLLGRLYAELGQYPQAIAAYQWVMYWDQTFAYPFTSDVADALDDAQSAQEDLEQAAEETEE
jgi:hypothetical protein